MPVLILEQGKQRAGLVLNGPVVIGRASGLDLVVHAEGMSRIHARIARESGRFYIEDLGSRNGVKVNQQRISGRVFLRGGNVIRLGRATFRYEDDDLLPQGVQSISPRADRLKQLVFRCGHCDAVLKAGADRAASIGRCRNCQRRLIIPDASGLVAELAGGHRRQVASAAAALAPNAKPAASAPAAPPPPPAKPALDPDATLAGDFDAIDEHQHDLDAHGSEDHDLLGAPETEVIAYRSLHDHGDETEADLAENAADGLVADGATDDAAPLTTHRTGGLDAFDEHHHDHKHDHHHDDAGATLAGEFDDADDDDDQPLTPPRRPVDQPAPSARKSVPGNGRPSRPHPAAPRVRPDRIVAALNPARQLAVATAPAGAAIEWLEEEEDAAAADALVAGEVEITEPKALGLCAVCQCMVDEEDTLHACTSCQGVYHLECWMQNHGCATYGCEQVHAHKPQSKKNANAPTLIGAALAEPKGRRTETTHLERDAGVPWDMISLGASVFALLLSLATAGLPSLVVLLGTLGYLLLKPRKRKVSTLAVGMALLLSVVGIAAGVTAAWWMVTNGWIKL